MTVEYHPTFFFLIDHRKSSNRNPCPMRLVLNMVV
ncbi:unnamed protein product [Ixodes pacificus]